MSSVSPCEQTHPLVDGLEVRRHKVCIAARHLKRGMPEHLLQVEDGPAAPEIVDGECVAVGLNRYAVLGRSSWAWPSVVPDQAFLFTLLSG
jgi:hypothetical protein